MTLLENFLPLSYARDLERELTSPTFPWNWNTNTVNMGSQLGYTDELTTDSQQFTHVMAHHQEQVSQYYPLVFPMLYFLEQKTGREFNVLRVKANMLIREPMYPSGHYNTQHIDTKAPSKACSLLYYVNSTDGDTMFFDDEHAFTHSVAPKMNSATLFSSTTWHASSPPRLMPNRIVLNFILEPKL